MIAMKSLEFIHKMVDNVVCLILGVDVKDQAPPIVEPQRFVNNSLTVASPLTYGEFNARKMANEVCTAEEPGFLLEVMNQPLSSKSVSFNTWVSTKKFHEMYDTVSLTSGFNFGTAVVMMHAGYRVSRKSWVDHSYLHIILGEDRPHFIFHDGNILKNTLWDMTEVDVLADDWLIVQ